MNGMVLDLGDDAKEYGRQALRAFEAAGGDQLVQQAEAKPDLRESLAGPALAELGAGKIFAGREQKCGRLPAAAVAGSPSRPTAITGNDTRGFRAAANLRKGASGHTMGGIMPGVPGSER